MSVEIELVGGPADGRTTVIPGDPTDPPPVHEVFHAVASGMVWAIARQGQTAGPGMRKLIYRRDLHSGDDSPLWRYRYDASATA